MAGFFRKSKIGRQSQTRIVKRTTGEARVEGVRGGINDEAALPSRFEPRTEPFNGFESPRDRF